MVGIGVLLAVIILAAAPGSAAAEPGAPGLGVDPPYGPPLTTVKLTGTGFCPAPCGPIQLTIASVRVDTGPFTWPADHTFTVLARVPGSARPGDVPVVATQTDATGQQIAARARFSVTINVTAPVHYPPPTGTQPPRRLPGTPAPPPAPTPPPAPAPPPTPTSEPVVPRSHQKKPHPIVCPAAALPITIRGTV